MNEYSRKQKRERNERNKVERKGKREYIEQERDKMQYTVGSLQ